MLNLTGKIEAILFINGSPISAKKIVELLEASEEKITEELSLLKAQLESDDRGLLLIETETGYQLVTKPAMGFAIEKIAKDEIKEDLTPAALETLSLVAYLGPISKPALEYIRGVNSSFTIRNLLVRGLVERSPNPEKSNSWLYKVTPDLIKHLGIESAEKLPEFEKYRELKNIFEENDTNKENNQQKK